RRRHTRFSRDWSSDVCSSDLRMVQKLDELNLLEYERYRGLSLTREGERVGRLIHERHKALERFLNLLGVHDQPTVEKDVEGLEQIGRASCREREWTSMSHESR